MVINYWLALLCAVISMVLGALWYGPLFGKKWMEIIGADASDIKRRKEMQKNAGPLYVIQFLLTFLQACLLSLLLNYLTNIPRAESHAVVWTLLFCIGFIIPTIAAGCMWNNESTKVSWERFLIQAGYQLVLFSLFGVIFG